MCGSADSLTNADHGADRKCKSSFPARPIEAKMSLHLSACSWMRRASAYSSSDPSISSINSALVSLMVASGVPSSWAVAATTPPKSVSFCSRANAIWVASRASDIEFISVVTRRV